MRIGIVGGLERAEHVLTRLAEAAGHEVCFHDGAMSPCGVRALARLVDHSDLVLVLTDVNSHGAVLLARRLMRERGRQPVLLRRCGSARFATLLAALERRERVAGGSASRAA